MLKRLQTYLFLHILLMFYSVAGILSKLAAEVEIFSLKFVLLYAGVLVILAIYALGWQQILKRLPLTSAFSNKAVTIVWGIIWGALFFSEPVTVLKAIGAVVIIVGVIVFSHGDSEAQAEAEPTLLGESE